MKTNDKLSYSQNEELANSITHGIGFFIGIAVLVLLVVFSALRKSAWEVVSCSVYGVTFIMLYLGSTLYHTRLTALRSVHHLHCTLHTAHCCAAAALSILSTLSCTATRVATSTYD